MSELLKLPSVKWATDANFPAGSADWSSTPTRVAPDPTEAGTGAIPAKQVTAQRINYVLGSATDAVGNLARVQAHSALTTWRQTAIPGTPATQFIDLVGLRIVRSFDANGDRQRAPVVFGNTFSDSNRLYMARSNDGSHWETPARAGVLGTCLFVTAFGPGEMVASNGPVLIFTIDHGHSWNTLSAWSGTLNWVGGHYSPSLQSSPRYYFLNYDGGVKRAVVLNGSTSSSALPGSVAVTAGASVDFADDGTNIVLCTKVASHAYASIYWSSDAGVTWTLAQTMNVASTNGNVTYNKALGSFVAWADTGEIYTSPTGQTWTVVSTNATTAHGFVGGGGTMASAGPAIVKLWKNVLQTGEFTQAGIAYSLDLGVTWNTWCPGEINIDPTKVKAFNNRLYFFDAFNVWVSGPLGLPGAEI